MAAIEWAWSQGAAWRDDRENERPDLQTIDHSWTKTTRPEVRKTIASFKNNNGRESRSAKKVGARPTQQKEEKEAAEDGLPIYI